MQDATSWKNFFQNWPAKIAPSGVLVTSFDEQIPFKGFLLSPDLILLDRKTPDTLGTRQVLLPYENIQALKITDVIPLELFIEAGFEPKSS